MAVESLQFPLYERADDLGVFNGGSALIVAPTATGKSHIGRAAICRAIERDEEGAHAYLVPFRALASEVYDTFADLLADTKARVRIATGDHRDPLRPDDADLVVATYESFIGLLSRETFQPGTVVADEVHLIADEGRGATVEGLFARLLASERYSSLCALSAVVENADELARWLGVPLLQGTEADRPVPLQLDSRFVDSVDGALSEVLEPCRDGEQALVFCNSRAGSQSAAQKIVDDLGPMSREESRAPLERYAERLLDEDDPDLEALADLVQAGVAYHHAGLAKPARTVVEEAFRERHLRVITCTPTLAAGVNLPADLTVVRNVFRTSYVRGRHVQAPIPSGEILNMLGRAGRPYQAKRGIGVALIEKRLRDNDVIRELVTSVQRGRGAPVTSRLPETFEGFMRLVLAVVCEHGETTRDDVNAVFERTLAQFEESESLDGDRPFEEDMMEDLPQYQKVIDAQGAICLHSYECSPEGVRAVIASSEKRYEVTVGDTGLECTCPAASQFYRGKICKHQACAIHDLLFSEGIDEEARGRALYSCAHIFAETLEWGTRISRALELLCSWHLIERVPAGWRATPLGAVASNSRFTLLLVHEAAERVKTATATDYREVAFWAVEDYIASENDRERWRRALGPWLDEVRERDIKLPARYRGDFERGLEDLALVCHLYAQAADAVGNVETAQAARVAIGAVMYGVAPELVPLAALNLPQLGRARCRLLFEQGITSLEELAGADPAAVADPRRAPEALVRRWVERAEEIHRARAVAVADREEADQEFDELVSRFRLDPAALG